MISRFLPPAASRVAADRPAPPVLPVLPSSAVAEEIYVGNATADTAARGWLLGHFMPDGDARHSEDVEIKWGVHPVGERRREWATADRRTTLSVLISGRFHIEFPDRAVLLAEQGDYVLFRGVGHSWYAEEAATLVTVRWPSAPDSAWLGPGRQVKQRPVHSNLNLSSERPVVTLAPKPRSAGPASTNSARRTPSRSGRGAPHQTQIDANGVRGNSVALQTGHHRLGAVPPGLG